MEHLLGKTYAGDKADKRPDLLLNENLSGEYLLIEFKRPCHALTHADYLQAIGYRHELAKYQSASIRVLVVGGSRLSDFPTDNREPQVDSRIFSQLISTARRQIEWLLRTGEGSGDAN